MSAAILRGSVVAKTYGTKLFSVQYTGGEINQNERIEKISNHAEAGYSWLVHIETQTTWHLPTVLWI
jgi:hypothetical protein